MNTGERIRAARIRKSMTQKELAERLGVKDTVVNRYETGTIVNLKRETIQSLSKILDVSPAYLMCWQDDITKNVGKKEQLDITLSRAQRAFISGLRACTNKEKAMLYQRLQQILEGDAQQ